MLAQGSSRYISCCSFHLLRHLEPTKTPNQIDEITQGAADRLLAGIQSNRLLLVAIKENTSRLRLYEATRKSTCYATAASRKRKEAQRAQADQTGPGRRFGVRRGTSALSAASE